MCVFFLFGISKDSTSIITVVTISVTFTLQLVPLTATQFEPPLHFTLWDKRRHWYVACVLAILQTTVVPLRVFDDSFVWGSKMKEFESLICCSPQYQFTAGANQRIVEDWLSALPALEACCSLLHCYVVICPSLSGESEIRKLCICYTGTRLDVIRS